MNTSTQGRTNSNCNSRRNSVSNTHKVYEQMLLKALPGTGIYMYFCSYMHLYIYIYIYINKNDKKLNLRFGHCASSECSNKMCYPEHALINRIKLIKTAQIQSFVNKLLSG